MEQNFISMEKLSSEKYSSLVQNYIELENAVESRPARPQDVQLVEELKKQLGNSQGAYRALIKGILDNVPGLRTPPGTSQWQTFLEEVGKRASELGIYSKVQLDPVAS